MNPLKLFLAIAALSIPALAQEAAPKEITIGVDQANPLKYDTAGFTVKAGEKVKLLFKNNCTIPQPHNVLIIAPGSLNELTAAALAMAADPQAMAKGYVPESDKVLHHTKLLQQGQEEVMEFTAPAEKGDYPFFCSFPGHAALMNGIMKVE